MIAYAYYGLGKTTLCNNLPDIFVDFDEEYAMHDFNQDLNRIKKTITNLSKHYIVLINGNLATLDIKVDIAFMPENIQMVIDRLENRGVDKSFIKFMYDTFNENQHFIRQKCNNIITLTKNEYLSDCKDYIYNLANIPITERK